MGKVGDQTRLTEFRGRFQVGLGEGRSKKVEMLFHSLFIHGFTPGSLRVKSENCLWVIVKTALKREVTSRES